jgi:excisionase family DNA binding protein
MSLEHAPQRQKRGPRKRRVIDRVSDTVDEFSRATGISKAVLYRMMADGRLRFAQVTPRMRRIPTTEYSRLGLSGETAA